jgi:DNA mismatch endonuclease (patch repair protein)
MADVHTIEQRSYNMSRIKGKNTRPEMLVRKFLHAQGFRYRLHDKKLPGKPDIVLTIILYFSFVYCSIG